MQPSAINIDLRSFSIFKDFDLEQIQHILALSTTRQLEVGEVLVERSQPNDTLFLLVEGELRIVVENDGSEVSFPILPGDCIGEMSLVLDQPTSAKAISHLPSQVLCIPEEAFWDKVAMTRKGLRNLMATMASRLRRANHALIQEMEEQIKYKQLEKDLETAGKIQSSIVPNGAELLTQCAEVDAHAFIKQAREVGGDFYDALLLDEDRLYFAIGDVSGKGMPAALFMMRAFTSLRMLISQNPKFDTVIPAVNDLLARNNEDMMFVSLFSGVLQLSTGKLRYVNGGHNPPFISLAGEGFQTLDDRNGPLLGIREKARFSVGELSLQKGDSLVLYTDGVSEAMNHAGEMFEMERLQAFLNAAKEDSMSFLVENLEKALDLFVGEAAQYDDFTVLALRYLAKD